jgi:6-pyruvoyltetrahydropterin/6-carboxytetrahydropterin synthase
MYHLQIQSSFTATHAIMMQGVLETPHEHDWRLRLRVLGKELDEDGLLCDFHLLSRLLDAAIMPFHNANLNNVPPFDTLNPTAELVAMHLATAIRPDLPTGLLEVQLAVTEAPGCEAIFTMDLSP